MQTKYGLLSFLMLTGELARTRCGSPQRSATSAQGVASTTPGEGAAAAMAKAELKLGFRSFGPLGKRSWNLARAQNSDSQNSRAATCPHPPVNQGSSHKLEPKWLEPGANFSSFRAHESQSLTGETKPTGYLPFGKVVGGLVPPIPPASRVAFTTRSTGLAHQCTEVLGTPVHWLALLAHQSF